MDIKMGVAGLPARSDGIMHGRSYGIKDLNLY